MSLPVPMDTPAVSQVAYISGSEFQTFTGTRHEDAQPFDSSPQEESRTAEHNGKGSRRDNSATRARDLNTAHGNSAVGDAHASPIRSMELQFSLIIQQQMQEISRVNRQEMLLIKDEMLATVKEVVKENISGLSNAPLRTSLQGRKVSPKELAKSEKSQEKRMIDAEMDLILSRDRQTWALLVVLTKRFLSNLSFAYWPGCDLYISGSDEHSEKDCSALAGYLTSKKKFCRKTFFSTKLGKEHSSIQREIATKLLWSARVGKLFSTNSSEDDDRSPASPTIPTWLYVFFLQSTRRALNNISFGCRHPNTAKLSDTLSPSQYSELWNTLTRSQQRKSRAAEKNSVIRHVHKVFDKLETVKFGGSIKDGHDLEEQLKNTGADDVAAYCSDLKLFSAALRVSRSTVSNTLSSGRLHARKCVFKNFGFILQYLAINKCEVNEDYGISLPTYSDKEKEMMSSETQLRRAVGEAVASKAGDDEETCANIDEENESEFEAMKQRFPSLTCTVWYQATFFEDSPRKRRRDSAADGDVHHVEKSWKKFEHISLHVVALRFLIEASRAESHASVLRSSPSSFLVLHEIALAFRGLIQKELGKPLTNLEDCLLRNVVLQVAAEKRNTRTTGRNSVDIQELEEDDHAGLLILDPSGSIRRLRERFTSSRKEYNEHVQHKKAAEDNNRRELMFQERCEDGNEGRGLSDEYLGESDGDIEPNI